MRLYRFWLFIKFAASLCFIFRISVQVHARCYGELEPTGGVLWLCNLCRPGAPESPLCCLCPVVGTSKFYVTFNISTSPLDPFAVFNKYNSRRCYETHDRWALGSSGLRHMDSRFLWFSTMYKFAQFFWGIKLSAYSSIFVQKHVYQMLKKWNLLMGFLESIRYLIFF